MRCLLIACALFATLVQATSAAAFKAPSTTIEPVTTTYWGVTVQDPYRWLEGDTPAVQRWISAQNDYAAHVFATFTHADVINARLKQLAITGPQQSDPKLVAGTLFYLRETPPQAQPVLVAQPWAGGTQRVLVDPNPAGGLLAIEGYWPSPDGSHVAYATQEAGAERTTIRVVDAQGRTLSDVLPNVGGGTSTDALAWDANGRGFVYTRMPLPTSADPTAFYFNSSLYHHTLGNPASSDTPSLGQGFSPVAEWNAMSAADGQVVALVHYGDGSYNAVWTQNGGAWQKVVDSNAGVLVGDDETAVTTAAIVEGKLYVIETADAPKGKIVEVLQSGPQTIVPEGDWAVRAVAAVRGGFLTTEVRGADWRVRHFNADGSLVRTVALPEHGIGVSAVASDSVSGAALIEYSGWVIPQRWVSYDLGSGALTQIYALKPPADYSDVEFTVLYATSKDGARVPVSVIHKKGVAAKSDAPGILTAYGGYGLSQRPFFLGSVLFWIEHGGTYAQANIRGGGEYGEDWHLNGRLTKKQNDYDDFAACARTLIDSGWVARDRLGIVGGSNGGLLMGAALVQHPELYRAVVSFAGDYDMLRVEDSPNGRYNVTEYGTVKDEAQFKALYAYSPYYNVRTGTAYPAVLMLSGANDPRVPPWQSRKMVARLQAASSSGQPVMLITRTNAGHGIGASFSQRLGDRSAMYIFFANELGLAL
ncbi:MAG: S9 family peptidase [Candidatus Eremiobacteraeota bacterium]|nr:S9 family peptidase [Candidatus Eremiobacteraeota bacterium]